MDEPAQAKAEPKSAEERLAELEHFYATAGIVEIAVRNPSVREFMEHWEGRALLAEKHLAEAEAAFDLRWKADMRAIKRWQDATGKTRTWPDHADLCVWLLEQLDAHETLD